MTDFEHMREVADEHQNDLLTQGIHFDQNLKKVEYRMRFSFLNKIVAIKTEIRSCLRDSKQFQQGK
jgi:hypothetical protein